MLVIHQVQVVDWPHHHRLPLLLLGNRAKVRVPKERGRLQQLPSQKRGGNRFRIFEPEYRPGFKADRGHLYTGFGKPGNWRVGEPSQVLGPTSEM